MVLSILQTEKSINSNSSPYQHPATVFYFAFWLCYFLYFWFNVFQLNEQGDLTIGQANMWADWALHFTLANHMFTQELIPQRSPLLINASFSYPFACDLISALLLRLGFELIPAFILPSLLSSLLLVYALYFFLFTLFKRHTVAVLACFIFFFNGGIGFYYLVNEAINSPDIWHALLNPIKEATNLDPKQIKWMSVLASLFLPQRSMMLGFPLVLIALTLILKHFKLLQKLYPQQCDLPQADQQVLASKASFSSINLILASVLLGLMPIIHIHSFLAAFIILSCWLLADLLKLKALNNRPVFIKHLKSWAALVGLVSLIALPLLFTFFFQHISSSHFSWHLGWMAKDYNLNWLVFWFKNWSFVPFIASITFLLLSIRAYKQQQFFNLLIFLPFFLLFALVNLCSLQPWIWDNTKILIWVSVGFSALTAYALVTLSHMGNFKPLNPVKNLILALLFIIMISSGLMDVYRNIRMDLHRYTMYNKVELELSEWVKKNSEIDSIWLVSPKHNHWLFNLTGRQTVMSYPGWLWSHGLNYQSIEADVKTMFKTADSTLLKKYQINYIIIDNYSNSQLQSNPFIYALKFKLVKKLGQYSIYKLPI